MAEELVHDIMSALPQEERTQDMDNFLLIARQYMAAVEPCQPSWPLLAAARHAAKQSHLSKRPMVAELVGKSLIRNFLPKMVMLCHPELQKTFSCVVARYHDNGLFANVLQVLDLLLLARPSIPVLVDWKRKGSEGHFQYGPTDVDLWGQLFEANERCRSLTLETQGQMPADAQVITSRVNLLFTNFHRGHFWTLPQAVKSRMRREYTQAYSTLQPTARIRHEVDKVSSSWTPDKYIVGVHKRLGTPEVAACQLSQRTPSCEEFVSRTQELLTRSTVAECIVFLATDDARAVDAFQQAFPGGNSRSQLFCRSGVKRSLGGVRDDGIDNEVHRSPCEVVDAEDALVDALCLAKCDDLVCIDSNLALFVAVTNATIGLHPLNQILPDSWEALAESPEEPVCRAYEVVHSGALFVQSGPSLACDLLGVAKRGEVFPTTGRAFNGWIELASGGWVLSEDKHGANLRPFGSGEPISQATQKDGGADGCRLFSH